MPDLRLSPTSYAILGLLAIKPWSTYEITKQMRRALLHVWPRAESNLYKEPQRLVEAGLATAERRLVGRRERTEYTITPAGRAALEPGSSGRPPRRAWSPRGCSRSSSAITRPRRRCNGTLPTSPRRPSPTDVPWRAIAQEYIDGQGPFPERIHVNVLYWVLLDRWARLRADWARWAAAEVARWPDAGGPVDHGEMLAMLERALGDEPDFLVGRADESRR